MTNKKLTVIVSIVVVFVVLIFAVADQNVDSSNYYSNNVSIVLTEEPEQDPAADAPADTPDDEAEDEENAEITDAETEEPVEEETVTEAPGTEAPETEEPAGEEAEETEAEAPVDEAPVTEEPAGEETEAAEPEAEAIETEAPEADAPDAEVIEAEVIETEAPEADTPDAEVIEAEVIETEAPEAEEEKIDVSRMTQMLPLLRAGQEYIVMYGSAAEDEGDIAALISAGEVIYLEESRGEWCQVVYGSNRGYVKANEIMLMDSESTTEEEKEMFRSVDITTDLGGRTSVVAGTEVTLTAHLNGFENDTYTIQWKYSPDGVTMIDIPGANGTSYTFRINKTNVQYEWYAEVTLIGEEE